MIDARGYAATEPQGQLAPFRFQRRDPGPKDVMLDLLYCGICHTDIHLVNDDWGMSLYPMVPGHEIVGRVTQVGADVTKLQPGDLAGIGCIVDSCRTCTPCEAGEEQMCEAGATLTYSSYERGAGNPTYGGYSSNYVVDEHFALKIPDTLDPAAAAPLLCAGITTYSPLRQWGVGPGQKVGVVGLGGLGHMGVKLAKAFGARVVLFTTSPGKAEDARRLGADEVVLSRDVEQMKPHLNSFDFILDTVSAPHDLSAYLSLLKPERALCLVGLPDAPTPLSADALIFGRKRLTGSMIGGLRETQEMLDFCGEHGITADIERIPIQQVNEAYERVLNKDVKYRFVIDLASLETA